MSMKTLTRRTAVFAVSVFAMAACGASGDGPEGGEAALQEITLGSDDAPVTVLEYASWTCPACLQFHTDVVGKLKSEYIETGKVKYVFREFPTAPAEISVAGFAVARCAGEDRYYDVLDELFSRQTAILSLARQGGQVKAALQQVAANNGISDSAEFEACLQNSDIRRAINASVMAGEQDGVSATPTVFLNGEQLEGFGWREWTGMQAVLNEALGEDAPGAGPAAAEEPAASEEDAMTAGGDMNGESTEGESEDGAAPAEDTAGETTPE